MCVERRIQNVCDHLLVLDRRRGEGPESIVGTYRLIRRVAAAKMGRFYSSAEYDIQKMIDYPGEVLELGRSCIARDARNTATMQMLWRGIALYGRFILPGATQAGVAALCLAPRDGYRRTG